MGCHAWESSINSYVSFISDSDDGHGCVLLLSHVPPNHPIGGTLTLPIGNMEYGGPCTLHVVIRKVHYLALGVPIMLHYVPFFNVINDLRATTYLTQYKLCDAGPTFILFIH